MSANTGREVPLLEEKREIRIGKRKREGLTKKWNLALSV
jgi:hypothetical protein